MTTHTDIMADLALRFTHLQWGVRPEWYDTYIGNPSVRSDYLVRVQEADDPQGSWVATLFSECRDWSCDEDIGRGATPILAMEALQRGLHEKTLVVGSPKTAVQWSTS